MNAADNPVPVPFWIGNASVRLPLFRCALGNGWVIWLRAPSSSEALKAALRELEDLLPDLKFITLSVSRHLEVPRG